MTVLCQPALGCWALLLASFQQCGSERGQGSLGFCRCGHEPLKTKPELPHLGPLLRVPLPSVSCGCNKWQVAPRLALGQLCLGFKRSRPWQRPVPALHPPPQPVIRPWTRCMLAGRSQGCDMGPGHVAAASVLRAHLFSWLQPWPKGPGEATCPVSPPAATQATVTAPAVGLAGWQQAGLQGAGLVEGSPQSPSGDSVGSSDISASCGLQREHVASGPTPSTTLQPTHPGCLHHT